MVVSLIEFLVTTVYLIISLSLVGMEVSSSVPTVRLKKRKLNITEQDALLALSKEDLVQTILKLKHELSKLKSKRERNVVKSTKVPRKNIDFTKFKTRQIALRVLYQGFNYDGFQAQSVTNNTIAQHLFNALEKSCLIESQESCGFSCSGRTDATVSSFGQVCTLSVRSKLNNPGVEDNSNELPYVKMLNHNMPKDIRILAWSPLPNQFSARFDCLHRNYKYWFPQAGLDIDAMNTAAQHLIGLCDFRNLCKMNVANGVVSFNRTVTHASVKKTFHNNQFDDHEHDMCEFHIRSQGFLWHQIRCIMSVLFLVGEGKEKPDILRDLCNIKKYPSKPVYPMVRGEPLNLYQTEFDPAHLCWHYDEKELSLLVDDLHRDWSLHSIKATMLGEMIKELMRGGEYSIPKLNINHLIDGIVSNRRYVPLIEREKCKSLDNRIQHFVKKRKLEVVADEKWEDGCCKAQGTSYDF